MSEEDATLANRRCRYAMFLETIKPGQYPHTDQPSVACGKCLDYLDTLLQGDLLKARRYLDSVRVIQEVRPREGKVGAAGYSDASEWAENVEKFNEMLNSLDSDYKEQFRQRQYNFHMSDVEDEKKEKSTPEKDENLGRAVRVAEDMVRKWKAEKKAELDAQSEPEHLSTPRHGGATGE